MLEHFLAIYARRYARPLRALTDETLAMLVAYDWPGNVRALRHAAERAVILCENDRFMPEDFPLPSTRPAPAAGVGSAPFATPAPDDLNLDRAERALVERALRKHGYNISNAAAELGLTRGTLYRRMEKHGL